MTETVGQTIIPINEPALITNDATVVGLLAIILGIVFYTAKSNNFLCTRFYRFVPVVLLCYFLPSLLNTLNIIDGERSKMYFFASHYLLPACLVLLTLSVDFKALLGLGHKALILFFVGTTGIVIGGPIALLTVSWFSPELLAGHGPETLWRGMTTIAGSWIGGGANQVAMKEIYNVGDNIFSAMVTVDVIIANIWMAILLVMADKAKAIDEKSGADTSAISVLKLNVSSYQAKHARITQLPDLIMICAVSLGSAGFAHFLSDQITPYFITHHPALARYSLHSHFFWIIVFSTALGIAFSFTKFRELEGVGASAVGSMLLYILIASIGMKMDVTVIVNKPIYFLIGGIWMLVHAGLMLIVARLIKAPLFYMAVASQANVGGAASAPVVASAFHPSLASVGVLLAVLGYAVGTYMAWFCGLILQTIGEPTLF